MNGEPSVEEVASALYETDPPESWMRTGTDEYRKRAAAMIDILRRDRTALTEAPPSEPLDVERLTTALWGLDFDDPEASKLARKIAAEYARLTETGEP